MTYPIRGEVWLVKLDPTIGSEIKKTRPALIISNNSNNRNSQVVTVLPISDRGICASSFGNRLINESILRNVPNLRDGEFRMIRIFFNKQRADVKKQMVLF